MPAAAVIPAPLAYIKVVAVKKLVVGFRCGSSRSVARLVYWPACSFSPRPRVSFTGCACELEAFTLKKLECSRQAL